MLVVSRHPHLEDVRKHVLEEAGYEVITVRNPEQVEEACKNHLLALAVIGYSVTTAEKRLIAAEITSFAGVQSWSFGIASRLNLDGAALSLIITR